MVRASGRERYDGVSKLTHSQRRSPGGGCDAEAALAQAVALPFEGDHGRVVDEPVDQGGGAGGSGRMIGGGSQMPCS